MGERTVHASVQTELTKDLVRLALFVELLLDGGAVRLSTLTQSFTLGGQVYTGAGSLGGIDKVEEHAGDIRASGIAMTLSGMPSSTIALVQTEQFQGRRATVWLAFFDLNWALIGSDIKLFAGKLDYPEIDETGETCKITVHAENQMIDLERARVRRYTHEDQIQLYPGDLGLEFVAAIQNREIIWMEHP